MRRRKLVTAAKGRRKNHHFPEKKKNSKRSTFFAGERRIGNGTHGMLKDAKEKEQEKNCMEEGWEIDSNKI